MVTGLLGRKLGMTRIFTEDGRSIPVTLLEVGPCPVVQRKTCENDRYEAVQLGFGEVRETRLNKPQRGHFGKAGAQPTRVLREFAVRGECELKPGDVVGADLFKAGDRVDVSGRTKGKGFAGVIKRHGFGGGPGGHGSMFHRAPGSIGMSADPARVLKGKPMPGRMGHVRVTVQNLEVVRVDADKNLLVVRGAVPGANGGVVEVNKSIKKRGRD